MDRIATITPDKAFKGVNTLFGKTVPQNFEPNSGNVIMVCQGRY